MDLEEQLRNLGLRQATLLPINSFLAHVQRRDKGLQKVTLPAANASLPSSFSLQPYAVPVYDQAQMGSCVENATSANLKMLNLHPNPSRLFMYTVTRLVEDPNHSPQDEGSNAMDIPLQSIGVCEEQYMPYNVDPNGNVIGFGTNPSQAAYQNALQHRCPNLVNITSADLVTTLKNALFSFIPVEIAFLVYRNFMTQMVATTGIVPMPTSTDTLVGGHEVLAIGWDDSKEAFLMQNSWGKNWGQGGFFWLPYAYFQGRDPTYGNYVSQLTIFPNAYVIPPKPNPTPDSTNVKALVTHIASTLATLQQLVAQLQAAVGK